MITGDGYAMLGDISLAALQAKTLDENMWHNRQERMDESYEYPNL